MVQTSVNSLGPLNVFVANAGIAQVKWTMDSTEADLQRLFEVNFYGVVYSDQAAARQFIKQGSGERLSMPLGNYSPFAHHFIHSLIFFSIVSFRPFLMIPIYCATKAAVRSLTQSLAMELAKENITVNAYAPGVVDSSMWETIDEGMRAINGLPKGENFKSTKNSITLGRTSVPEDVAKMVSFLASPDSDYVTGQTMLVDGGMVFS